MNFYGYRISNGEIIMRGCSTAKSIADVGIVDDEIIVAEGELSASDLPTKYVYNGQIVGRPLMDTHPTVISKTDNVAENEVITITGVPAGADIYIDGEKYNLAAGETVLELTFDTVGTYRIRIVSFPYQDWERTVTVI